jgi:hypothetical protein
MTFGFCPGSGACAASASFFAIWAMSFWASSLTSSPIATASSSRTLAVLKMGETRQNASAP